MIENLDKYESIVAHRHIENFEKLNNLPIILQNTNRLNKHMKNSNIANYKIT